MVKSWPPVIHSDTAFDHLFAELDTLQKFQKELAKFQGRKLAILALTQINEYDVGEDKIR